MCHRHLTMEMHGLPMVVQYRSNLLGAKLTVHKLLLLTMQIFTGPSLPLQQSYTVGVYAWYRLPYGGTASMELPEVTVSGTQMLKFLLVFLPFRNQHLIMSSHC